MAGNQRYDEAKFTELVLYVARGLEGDPEGGAVKLNKALWWAECASVRMFGRSISGAEYQKLKQGPAPRRLLPVRERIVANGDAEIQPRWFMGYRQDRLVVTSEPSITLLSEAEKEIVDQVLAALRGRTATDLSTESHEEMGWRMVDFYETIPMESAYLARTSPVTPKIREHARQLAERLGMTSQLVLTGGRRVGRSEFFIETAMRYFPPGGSVDGRPSFEFFEEGPLRAIEMLFARSFDELPEPYPGIREWTTIEAPFFPPMTFYGVMIVGEKIELVDLTVDEDLEWQSPGDADYDEPT